jgi:polyhydroxyalkanoate synthase
MSAEHQVDPQAADNLSDQAARHTLALNPLVGVRGKDLFDSAGILIKAMVNEPRVAVAQWLSFLGELTDIVSGKSERAPQPGDKRFSDSTWTNSTLPLAQGLSRLGRGGRKFRHAQQPERGR